MKRPKPTCSYEYAGAAADEVRKIVWGTRHDRNIWAGFCRYGNFDDPPEPDWVYFFRVERARGCDAGEVPTR